MTPMIVQCSSCLTEFELDPNKVPAAGVRARCSVCSAVIVVPAPPVHAAAPTPTTHEAASVAEAPSSPTVAAASEKPAEREAPPAWERPAAPTPVPSPSLAQSSWTAPKAPTAQASPSTGDVEPEEGQRRSINPFLTRDPALRAKRLARALVSDIVAYHPARHAEGLRDGTLKTLFRDEIKKSYEEYVDQVGRDFAGSTTQFQDALNDVLASGKKLF